MERVTPDAASAVIGRALAGHRDAVDAVASMTEEIARAAGLIATSLENGGQLLVCGNGGSAADAQHMAAEFVGRFLVEREPWPALALHANASAVTAIGNDYGFEQVFARQVRAHGRKGDVLLAISTSGASPNILLAIDEAHRREMSVIGLSGGGGAMATRCDVCLAIPSVSTPRIQEAHILVEHILCELVEAALA